MQVWFAAVAVVVLPQFVVILSVCKDLVNSINKPFCLFKCCTHSMTWQRLHAENPQTNKKYRNKKDERLFNSKSTYATFTFCFIKNIFPCGNRIPLHHMLPANISVPFYFKCIQGIRNLSREFSLFMLLSRHRQEIGPFEQNNSSATITRCKKNENMIIVMISIKRHQRNG